MQRFCLLAVMFLLGHEARADDPPVFPGESAALGRRFQELAKKEEAARKEGTETLWAEALDELQAILDSAGDELAPLGEARVVQARRACQERLARLPADALRLYRRRAEMQARKWLDEATPKRDARLLQRIVEEAYCTDSARSALELLGDLAFERGDLNEAQTWWRLIALPPDARKGDASLFLVHPDSAAEEARAHARQLLARWFSAGRDRPDEWAGLLDRFRKRHPDATGYLAGAKGLYWKRLQDVAAHNGRGARPKEEPWVSFAGAMSRNHIAGAAALTPEGLLRLSRDGIHRRFPLAENAPGEDQPREVKTPADYARSMAFHPIIIAGKVLIADARLVTALDIRTGKREVWLDANTLGTFAADLTLPAPADVRYTVTAAGDCVLVRVGVQALRSDRNERDRARDGSSFLVCLDLQPDAKGSRERWRVALEGPKNQAIFEGCPVVDHEHAYIAVTRFEGHKTTTAIHCYPLAARGIAPLKWKRDVCVSRELGPGETRLRHHLLTLARPQLFYCTHWGAVVALDTSSGRLLWGTRYRQERVAEEEGRRLPARDLNPPLVAGGRLYVAPADSDLLLCLEPMTGKILWERDRIEVIHLLGVSRDRLLFTTRTPSPGLRAVNALDGGDVGGWFRTGLGQPIHSLGRGLLAGDLVLWPTLHHVYFVRQEDGEQPDDPTLALSLPSGNIAFGEGTLVIAGLEELHVFAPPRLQLPELKKEIKEKSSSSLSRGNGR